MAGEDRRVFRFGVFEADAASGELRKSGMRLRVQEQPFQVLLMLLSRPGEVVTREEVRQKLWPSDTFVDFDHSVNTIINKLREALGDSASNPRFIETLAKRGYRFLVPVEIVGNHRDSAPTATPNAGISTEPKSSLLTRPEDLPQVHPKYVRILFVLIQAMYLGFYIAALARLAVVEDLLTQMFGRPWMTVLLIVSAAVGIPIRLYLLTAAAFDVKDLTRRFLRLFPYLFILDELWALSPFLLTPQIGLGLALGITAALLYVPFSQRTLLLMRDRHESR